MTLQEFIDANSLTMASMSVSARPDSLMSDDMNHFQVTIHERGKAKPFMSLYYSMGLAHEKSPTLTDVLECLASDARSVEEVNDLDDWLLELGYDVDEMPHGEFLHMERVYKAVISQSRELESLLGSEEWDILLNDVVEL